MEEIKSKLCDNDLQIIDYLRLLREQRNDICIIIDQQKREKTELETELERIVYKLKIIDKSLTQRITTLENYDKKIADVEEKYSKIVERSESLLFIIKNDLQELENIMDKKIGTTIDDKCGNKHMCSTSSNVCIHQGDQ